MPEDRPGYKNHLPSGIFVLRFVLRNKNAPRGLHLAYLLHLIFELAQEFIDKSGVFRIL